MNHLRAVLMDIDGTLLDSAEAQTQSWLRVLQDFGYAVEYRQVRARIGMGQDRMLRELCGISEASPRARRMLTTRELLLRAYYFPNIATFPHVSEFLARIQRSGAKLAVVTSLPRREALALLGRGQLLTEFDHVLCKEDAAQSKPAADGVLAALERMGMRPDQAIMVGCSPYDLAAAHAAQVPSVALKSAGWPDSALLDAVSVYRDVADLLNQFDRSPLGQGTDGLSVPSPFMWREPGLIRRAPRPSRPHAA
jgi:phosphoglycolate phosphatase-like HAD superfamily hydrolase